MFLFRRILWTNPLFLTGLSLVLILGAFLFLDSGLNLLTSSWLDEIKWILGILAFGCLLLGWTAARREDNKQRARFL